MVIIIPKYASLIKNEIAYKDSFYQVHPLIFTYLFNLNYACNHYLPWEKWGGLVFNSDRIFNKYKNKKNLP